MNERQSQFLRRQAELCIGLSRATFDLTLAGRLRAIAEEFRRKAAEWEHADSPHAPSGYGASVSSSGALDHN